MERYSNFRDVIEQTNYYSSQLSPQERDRISEAEGKIRTQETNLNHLLYRTPLSAVPQARKFLQGGQSIIFANAAHFGEGEGVYSAELTEDQKREEAAFFGQVPLDVLFDELRASANRERTFISYERRRKITIVFLPPAPMQEIKPESLKSIPEPKELDDSILPAPETSSPEVEAKISTHIAAHTLDSTPNCPLNPLSTTSAISSKPETESKLLPSDILTSNDTDVAPALKEKKKVSKLSTDSPSNDLKEIDPNSLEGIKISFFELLKAGDMTAALSLARKHFKTDFLREIHRAVIWAFENSNITLAHSILKAFPKAKTRRFMNFLRWEKHPLDQSML